MSTNITQDYHGALYFIEENDDRDLTVFIVDDNEFYLLMIKEKLAANPKLSVHAFKTGEDCLGHLSLKPDLVILDYHLDGTIAHAAKGDVIAEKIKKEIPYCEVMIISSDDKLDFIESLVKKDDNIVDKITSTSEEVIVRKESNFLAVPLLIAGCVVLAVVIFLLIR